MALQCKVGSITVPGATGNQATTGIGFQPKVVLFFGVRRSADGASLNAVMNPDGGMEWPGCAVYNGTAYQQATLFDTDDYSSGNHFCNGNQAVHVEHANAGGIADFNATIVSLDSDGFTLNWTVAAGAAYIVNYVAIGGADLTDIYLKSLTPPTTAGPISYTGVGFQPDAMVVFGAMNNFTGCLGFASNNGGTINQGCHLCGWVGDIGNYLRTDKIYACMNSSTAPNHLTAVTSFDADGFTFDWTSAAANAGTHTVFALCLKGGNFKAGVFTQKTSTGDQAYTGVGFRPVGIIRTSRYMPAGTTNAYDAGQRMHADFGAADGISQATSNSQDGSSGVCAGLDRTKFFKLWTTGATTQMDASLSTFDSDGFTLNYSTVDAATAREAIYLAFGSTSTGSVQPGADGSLSTGTGTTLDYTGLTVGTENNRALVLMMAFDNDPGAVTVCNWDQTGTPQALTQIGTTQAMDTWTSRKIMMFGLVNPTAGTKTLRVTWTNSVAYRISASYCYNAKQTGGTTTFRTAQTSNWDTTATTGAITSSEDDYGYAISNQEAPGTPVPSDILIWSSAGGGTSAQTQRGPGRATNKTFSWTISSTQWGAIGVSVAVAPAKSAALTGTALAGITETDVVAGGKTIIITLTGDTWIPA